MKDTEGDISELSHYFYGDVMSGHPSDIVQARVPDENPFVKVHIHSYTQNITYTNTLLQKYGLVKVQELMIVYYI